VFDLDWMLHLGGSMIRNFDCLRICLYMVYSYVNSDLIIINNVQD